MSRRQLSVVFAAMLFGVAPIASASAIVSLDRDRPDIGVSIASTIPPDLAAALDQRLHPDFAADSSANLTALSMLLADAAIAPNLLDMDAALALQSPGAGDDAFVSALGGGDRSDASLISPATPAAIPEPATLGLLACALVGLSRHLRRRRG